MMKRCRGLGRSALLALCALARLADAADTQADPAADAFFESKVRPILVARCLECHGDSGKAKGGLRLTSKASILQGGDSGPSAVAGKPDESPLVAAIRYADEPRMPPKGKLPDGEVAALERWVALGLPWPEAAVTPAATAPASAYRITDEQRRFWSFRPVRGVEPPPVRDAAWPANPVDRFILAGLEAAGLEPSPPADRATLIRRATFDLTGLPPTPDEVAAFLADGAPDAFARVVDRLLDSPAYGQRWARHWLDVARYADSRDARGVGGSDDIGEAWRYRDWVVDAFNRDLPYDRFVVDQVAGDLVPGPVPGDINAPGMVATGLLAIGEWGTGDADKEKMLTDIVADQVDVVTRGFLGLTVACARCHDHKFDPISAADYYGLAGIFFSTRIVPDPGPKTGGSPMLRTPIATRADREAIADHARKLAEARSGLEAARSAAAEGVARSLLPDLRAILAAAREPGSSTTPGFAARQWRALLSGADPARFLAKAKADVDGRRGVHFWTAESGLPWVGVNGGDKPAALGTLTLPPRSAGLHPGTRLPASIRWRSPIAGPVRATVRINDADPNGGNGVDWSVAIRRRDGARPEVAKGEMDNGGSATPATRLLARVEVQVGDSIELTVGPRGDYSFDTTTVAFQVEPAQPGGPGWDLAADLLPDPLASNPHADRLGHPGVWELAEVDPLANRRPLPDHPAWSDWDRSDRSAAAVEALAARVEADPKLLEALIAPGGPLRPAVGDEGEAFPESVRLDLKARQAAVDRLKGVTPPPPAVALSAVEGGVPRSVYEGFHDARIQVRGDYRRLGPEVPRHVPEVIAGPDAPKIERGSGRLELARWIASKDNPLTARVAVNRIWQGHFGSGLVRTPGNFGKLGEAPTHPELLDWLATRFISDDWSVKALHRLLMTSRTYQQSSAAPPGATRLDPENRLWGRAERRRLEAEAVRDSLLMAAGRLDPSLGGPSTRDFAAPRRTLYLMTIRSDRSSFGPLFDAADSTAMVDRRVVSTVAPQALFLLNNPFAVDQARALGDRLRALPGDDDARIARAYLTLYGRGPTAEESGVGRDYLAHAVGSGNTPEAAWHAYAQVLLCANEFLYVD